MSDQLTQAVYDRLASDAALDGMLARTVIGDEAGPAIYTTLPAPVHAVMPYVIANGGAIADLPVDTFDAQYRDQLRDIHVYAAKPDQGGGSVGEVNAIAERVRALLHRRPLEVASPFRNILAACAGPVVLDDETAFGRVITLRLLLAQAAA